MSCVTKEDAEAVQLPVRVFRSIGGYDRSTKRSLHHDYSIIACGDYYTSLKDDVRHFCTDTLRPLLPAPSPFPTPAARIYLCLKNLDVQVVNLSAFMNSVERVDLESVNGDFKSVCERLDDKMVVIFVHLMFTD
ncbi:hypothetical protein CYMTET_44638 [Cymbomonas tetramitiformis]|uniref:Uncharacterized protein n=1 Tax=Cymbomonas tetramitiformis TaxID=36881 RepID=A0AAE0C1Y1_9CHLO|nr:hypothetical protein CYMTET_44638 [Cymbomonas tetramitiformis]